jgi:hypothetical protein
MATQLNPEKHKKADLPPKGPRNPDPITDAPGAHPIETGVGAAAVGAAAGAAGGAFAGPAGAAVGAVVGAVAGGYGGKAVGEMIDPTTEDTWLRDNFSSRPYVRKGDTFEKYQPAYQYGGLAESRYGTEKFERIEPELEREWHTCADKPAMTWPQARDAVKDSYERTAQIRRTRDVPEMEVCDEELDDR